MEYDKDKVDEMMLALLYPTGTYNQFGTRSWKGFKREPFDRLIKKGYISDPGGKSRTGMPGMAGAALSKELFLKHFRAGENSS